MALAWGISCLSGHAPTNKYGYSAVGEGDLYSFGVIARKIWGSSFLTNTLAAEKQLLALFNLVAPEHAGGNPNDLINDPSLDCRDKAMQAGIVGGGLPPCAGGVAPPPLTLDGALVVSPAILQLTFSEALADTGVADVGNYTFDPAVPVTAAAISPCGAAQNVLLVTQLVAGQKYVVKVSNLVSVEGTPLDPAHSSVSFTMPG